MKTLVHKKSFSAFVLIAALATLLMPFASFAAATNWELTAPTGLVFTCDGQQYPHTIQTITQTENGTLTGTGTYDPNQGFTWDLTGNITGDNITFTIIYTGISSGSVYTQTGTISQDGSVSGLSSANCQTFNMPAGSLVPIEVEPAEPTVKEDCKNAGWEEFGFKNQGQCIRFVETGKDSR